MSSQLHTDLIAVRELLTPPENWGKDDYAKPNGAGGTCYCLHDATYKVAGATLNKDGRLDLSVLGSPHLDVSRKLNMTTALQRQIGGGLASFNDHEDTAHSDVLRVINRAIEANP